MRKTQRIEICGNIASGKTTLAKGFTSCGLTAVEEKFDKNPFIDAFYTNPSFFSFETEITFILQHYHSIKITDANNFFVCDYSLVLDKAYADVTLTKKRNDIFLNILEELEHEIGLPSIIIHLQCPEQILLTRILNRRREFESSIDIEYLKSLTKAIDRRINEVSQHIKVITINSHEINFINGIDNISTLKELMPF